MLFNLRKKKESKRNKEKEKKERKRKSQKMLFNSVTAAFLFNLLYCAKAAIQEGSLQDVLVK